MTAKDSCRVYCERGESMPGLHCADCEFSSFKLNKEVGLYQASCARGYTLADPRNHHEITQHFADTIDKFVPIIDPFGNEYLRKTNVCDEFTRRIQKADR